MTIRIIQHIPGTHYPGQILVDSPQELEWLKSGHAVAIKSERETAAIAPHEEAVTKAVISRVKKAGLKL